MVHDIPEIELDAAAAHSPVPGEPEWLSDPGFDPNQRVIYRWLAANGVTELMPMYPALEVRDGRLIYLGFRWDGPRGFDVRNLRLPQHADDPSMRLQEVPLLCPVTDKLRKAIEEQGGTLVEN